MGKTRDLFKKIRDTKGTFQAKMGSIKDRNGMDLTEAEDIKKRWQEYTELYKKDLHDQDNHDGASCDIQKFPDMPGSLEGNTERPGTTSSELLLLSCSRQERVLKNNDHEMKAFLSRRKYSQFKDTYLMYMESTR